MPGEWPASRSRESRHSGGVGQRPVAVPCSEALLLGAADSESVGNPTHLKRRPADPTSNLGGPATVCLRSLVHGLPARPFSYQILWRSLTPIKPGTIQARPSTPVLPAFLANPARGVPQVPSKWVGAAHNFFLEEYIRLLHNCLRNGSQRGGTDYACNGKFTHSGLAVDGEPNCAGCARGHQDMRV